MTESKKANEPVAAELADGDLAGVSGGAAPRVQTNPTLKIDGIGGESQDPKPSPIIVVSSF